MSAVLEVRDLKIHYEPGLGFLSRRGSPIRAVDGVSFGVQPGEVFGIVGESGCGKSTIARCIAGLVPPSGGQVLFAGHDLRELHGDAYSRYRRGVQMIFQDPAESLNPRKTVFQSISQPLRMFRTVPAKRLRDEVSNLLEWVGLSPASQFLDRYPHQFSGGQRQRICIARAIALRPRIVVADESVSALDVSIRAQILRLFQRMARELDMAVVFITHDLGVVRALCPRVAVMYLGRIVEIGTVDQVFASPLHPYTRALLAACPRITPSDEPAATTFLMEGEVPSPANPPSGCHLHPRCPVARDCCATDYPPLRSLQPDHDVACHNPALTSH